MSGASQEPEGLVVEQAVGCQHRARVDVGLAREVGELAARLLDKNLHGRHVPGLQVGLGVDLRLTLRHQAVAEVVAEAALPRGRVHEALESSPEPGGAQDVQARMDQERGRQEGARRDGHALAVGPCALAPPRPEELAGGRVVDHARRHLPVLLEAISTAQKGMWRTKFFVPSMGSMIHRFLVEPSWPNSSPRKPHSGVARARMARIAFSASWSAWVTGVLSGLMVTWKPPR